MQPPPFSCRQVSLSFPDQAWRGAKADSTSFIIPLHQSGMIFPRDGVGKSSTHKKGRITCPISGLMCKPPLSRVCPISFSASPSPRATLSLHSSASATVWIFSLIFGFLSVDAETQLGPISSGKALTWERLQVSYVCCDSSFFSSLLQENQLKKQCGRSEWRWVLFVPAPVLVSP